MTSSVAEELILHTNVVELQFSCMFIITDGLECRFVQVTDILLEFCGCSCHWCLVILCCVVEDSYKKRLSVDDELCELVSSKPGQPVYLSICVSWSSVVGCLGFKNMSLAVVAFLGNILIFKGTLPLHVPLPVLMLKALMGKPLLLVAVFLPCFLALDPYGHWLPSILGGGSGHPFYQITQKTRLAMFISIVSVENGSVIDGLVFMCWFSRIFWTQLAKRNTGKLSTTLVFSFSPMAIESSIQQYM